MNNLNNNTTKFLLSCLALVLFGALSGYVSAETPKFNRNLGVGSVGADVLNLQIELNKTTETTLANSGPGSPGNETQYFGPLTFAAVVKYQELFKEEVLEPLGLSKGTGYVGPSTRAKLNVEKDTPDPENILDISRKGPDQTTTDEAAKDLIETTKANLDEVLVDVRKSAFDQGYSEDLVEEIEKAITESVENLTEADARRVLEGETAELGTFEELLLRLEEEAREREADGVRGAEGLEYGDPIPTTSFVPFYRLISGLAPKTAHAQAGLLDFGGNLTFFVPCTCPPGPVFMVIRGSTIVTPVWLLDYIPGTQIKLAFNLPLPKVDLTGKWTTGAVRACWWYVGVTCIPSPAYGLITPLVGSALIPKPSI